MATTAEEYFSLGMAYFDLGQAATDANTRVKYFLESEKWLNQARLVDKTKNASEYNIGRIAFETGRYKDAAQRFEGILKKDPNNVLALKAAAYTRIKMGDIELAAAHYKKLLTLVPDSADDGYNYALVLYSMEKYEEAEQALSRNQFALLDNNDILLLYARTQKAQDKVEAVETYARWLQNNKNPVVRCEYAASLEKHDYFAKALEEYRAVLEELNEKTVEPKKSDVLFYIARVLLIADNESDEGINELEKARAAGFENLEELEKLVEDERIGPKNINALKTIVAELKQKIAPAVQEQEGGDSDIENGQTETADQ
jgi:tetratricopeptide (TPR) repeat protein